MASGLSEKKERLKSKMGYWWTAQTKEPQQRSDRVPSSSSSSVNYWSYCVVHIDMSLRMIEQVRDTVQLVQMCLSLLMKMKNLVSEPLSLVSVISEFLINQRIREYLVQRMR